MGIPSSKTQHVFNVAPQVCDPYLCLATIYEELKDEMKLFQILLIAAHLKRTDKELWLQSAALAKKLKNFRVASQCISKGELSHILLLYKDECSSYSPS